ncbi:MAG: hypothetical protein JXB88_06445 [Spirochaetales bacterium]|nr:hypothetical protein [Spirochaetales bacterium]
MGENNIEILKNIKNTHEKLSGTMVNATLTNRMKNNISVLLDMNIHYCDMIINADGTRQYVCKTDEDIFTVVIQGNELLIFSDKKQELFARYTFPFLKENEEPEEQWSISFTSNNELYIALEKIKTVLNREPDALFYVLVAWGEWEEPIHFLWQDWNRKMKEIEDAHTCYDYQINCDFKVNHNIVRGRSNSVKNEIWITASGSKEFIQRIKGLF